MIFLAFVLMARHLGTTQFGIFSFMLAVVGLFQVAADFGLTTILVRDMARDKLKAADMHAAAAFLAGMLSVGILLITALLSYWWAASSEILWTCWTMGVAAAISIQTLVFASVSRAYEEMRFNAAGNVTHRLLLVLFIGIAIYLEAGLVGIGIAFLLANLYHALFFYTVVRLRYFPIYWRLVPDYWAHLLSDAIPVGVATVFRRSTIHAGTLLLAALSTPHVVGLFSAAVRIMQIIEMLPSTLSVPLLPVFSRLAKESNERMFRALGDTMRIFAIIGFPLLSWVLLAAPKAIGMTFGPAYEGAVPALQIMSLAIILFFVTSLYIYVFSALGQQKLFTLSTAICFGVAIVSNIALIPTLGANGAAIALVMADLAFFVSGFVLLRRQGFNPSILALFGKPLFASVAAGTVLLAASETDSVLKLIGYTLVYGITYILLIVVLKGVRKEELRLLRSAFQSRLNL